MIEAALLIIIGAAFVGLAFCYWALICNNRAYRFQMQRLHLASEEAKRRIANNDTDWCEPYERLNNVDYNDVMWSFVFFKDPMKLYEQANQQNRRAAA